MALQDRGGAPSAGLDFATVAYISGLYAPLASPAFTGIPTAPTAALKANSTQIATTAYVQANSPQQGLAANTSGTAAYTRLATITASGGSGGADVELLIAGLGDWSSATKGVALVVVGQRGTGASSYDGRVILLTKPLSGFPTFYVKNISSFSFEVWMLGASYQFAPSVTQLGGANATINLDSVTTTAPSGLVALNTTVDIEAIPSTYAPLASPAFSGVPTAPMPGSNINTTQIAPTAWVNLYYAPLASPSFTGAVKSDTQFTAGVSGGVFTTYSATQVRFWTGGTTEIGNLGTTASTGEIKLQSLGGQLTLGGASPTNATQANLFLGNDGTPRMWSSTLRARTVASANAGGTSTTPASTDNVFLVLMSNGTIATLNDPTATVYFPFAYGDVITTRATFVSAAGHFGTSASSKKLKNLLGEQHWGDAELEKWLAIPVHRFKYKDGIAAPEEAHLEHMGMLAEDVHDAGFTHFVHYEERKEGGKHHKHGEVAGLAYDRMAVLDHLAMRRMLERIEALEARLPKEPAAA